LSGLILYQNSKFLFKYLTRGYILNMHYFNSCQGKRCLDTTNSIYFIMTNSIIKYNGLLSVYTIIYKLEDINMAKVRDTRRNVSESLKGTKQLFINGKWVDAAAGKTFEVKKTAKDEYLASASEAGAQDVDAAVHAAREAFDNGPWSKISAA